MFKSTQRHKSLMYPQVNRSAAPFNGVRIGLLALWVHVATHETGCFIRLVLMDVMSQSFDASSSLPWVFYILGPFGDDGLAYLQWL